MSVKRLFRVFGFLVILSMVLLPLVVFAQGPLQLTGEQPTMVSSASATSKDMVSIIVDLNVEPLATYAGGVNGFAPTSPKVTGARKLDVTTADAQAYRTYVMQQLSSFKTQALQAVPSAQVIHDYDVVIGGVSMLVPADQVKTIAGLSGVKKVYMDTMRYPLTDASNAFIGSPTLWNSLGGQESAGEGVVVGVIDTGIWPEHPSFSDPDPSGKAYPAPPASWKGTRCDFNNDAPNPGDSAFQCNNKLIGAAEFLDTYKALTGLNPEEFDSARDDNGHGTHTASTAAGDAGVDAVLLGVDRGIVSGIAPRAHVAAYKALGELGGYSSDLAAAINQAVADGVDVINYSVGGSSSDPYNDTDALAYLDAYAAGVFVATSAGNSGPGANTVGSPADAPWVMTVGASTSDRNFISTLTVTGQTTDTVPITETRVISGASVTAGIITPTTVLMAADYGDEMCLNPFAAGTFHGEIVVCKRGVIARVEKSYNVAQGGAGGMILYNPTLLGLATDNHFVPSVHLENDAGQQLLDFMAAHTNTVASFTPGVATKVKGDVMAAFSSRGGTGNMLGVSRPDITAPGVQILAGNTPQPSSLEAGVPGELFQSIQGTSMSSPHIAGSGALLKALHPDWTPGQIKSAIMTTAKTDGVTKEDGTTPADAFDYGSGRVDLTKAGDPGITFSASYVDFATHKNDLWNINYPSVYFPVMPGIMTVQRTAHSELSTDSTWTLSVEAPDDVNITVPASISIPAGGDTTFSISVDASTVPLGETRFAQIMLTDGTHMAHMPVTLVRRQADVTVEKDCGSNAGGSGSFGDFLFNCTITMTNYSPNDALVAMVDNMPDGLELVSGSTIGGSEVNGNVLYNGTLRGKNPPVVSVADYSSYYGYLPLESLGVTPISDQFTDDSIVNFDVPTFTYAGKKYSTLGINSNGYVVVGGGDATTGYPQVFPNASPPNNVIAPFWTDLNIEDGGDIYIDVISDGNHRWIIVEWKDIAPWDVSGEFYTFELWIETDDSPNYIGEIYMAYDRVDGLGADWTKGFDPDHPGNGYAVGAEDELGTSGGYYTNLITTTTEIQVVASGEPFGGQHVVSFNATGTHPGDWTNYVHVDSDIFDGTSVAFDSGFVGVQKIYMPLIFKQ